MQVSKRHCKRSVAASLKPPRKRKCPKKACGFHSCADVRKRINATRWVPLHTNQGVDSSPGRDGEYPVLLGGRNISVYCHDMATNWPR